MPEPESGDPWLTVVTVVKDDPVGFERTAASLAGQALAGVEWVVVDGSGDAEGIPRLIGGAPGPAARYEWCPPAGVYAAMNTGLARVTGTYVLFLNAGDALHDDAALATIREVVDRDRPVWLYGQVCFVSPDGRETIPPPFDYAAERSVGFSRGRFPPHQGTVVSTRALRDIGGFDTSYRIVADYAALLRLSMLADPSTTDAVLATFVEGGISSTSWRASIGEFHRARREILRPSGVAALRERTETTLQFARIGVARLAKRLVGSRG